MGEAKPGWYEDGSGRLRWYDGKRWTDSWKDKPGTTPPPPSTPPPPTPGTEWNAAMDKAAAPDLQKQGKGSGFWGCLGCLGVVLVAVVVFGITGANSGGGSRDSAEAIAQCENRIERLLKSPSTARFNSSASGSGTLKVTGTVDSENGFGAMIRSSFGCTVVLNEETNTATTTVDYLN